MLDHRGEGERHDSDDRGNGEARVEARAKQREYGVVPAERQADPRGFGHAREIDLAHGGCGGVAYHHADKDGDDFHHAASPNVAYHDGCDGDNRHDPIGGAVRDGGACQNEADANHDGTRDHGREEAHDACGAECAEERRKHQIKQASACNAEARVGQKLGLAVGSDGGVACDERERRAQKRWHLALGQNMEEQRAQAGEQQRVAYRKAREHRHQNGGAEHREHMLNAQHKYARLAEGACVVNGARGFGPRSGAGGIAHGLPF